jgi:predicted DsbA family dithiol-disulfide isomerase
MSKLLKIDVFTDVVCPWCLVGSARLDQAVAKLGDDIEVVIDNHPFYLDPNVPPEGVDVGEMLRTKYGKDPRPGSRSICRSSRACSTRRRRIPSPG